MKEAIPKGKVKKGTVHKAVVVRVKKGIHRNDGSKVKFDNNAAVLVDDKGEPVKLLMLITSVLTILLNSSKLYLLKVQ